MLKKGFTDAAVESDAEEGVHGRRGWQRARSRFHQRHLRRYPFPSLEVTQGQILGRFPTDAT